MGKKHEVVHIKLYQFKGGGVVCPDVPVTKIITGKSDQLNKR
jgi:hypothetical protein